MIVDEFVGDGAMALFIPGFAGSDDAALDAAHRVLGKAMPERRDVS